MAATRLDGFSGLDARARSIEDASRPRGSHTADVTRWLLSDG